MSIEFKNTSYTFQVNSQKESVTIFSGIPKEILEKVLFVYLKFQDVCNVFYTHRDIPKIYSNKLVELFFAIDNEALNNLVLDIGIRKQKLDIVNRVLIQNRYSMIKYLGLALSMASRVKYEGGKIVKAIIKNPEFIGVHTDFLDLAFSQACSHDKEIVKDIIGSGRYKDIKISAIGAGFFGAAQNGLVEVIKDIIATDRFDDMDVIDLGQSLWIASQNGHLEVVKAILICTRSYQIRKEDSGSALWMAAREGHREIVALLIKHAGPNDISESASTALSLATGQNRQQVVEIIVNAGLKGIDGDSLMRAYSKYPKLFHQTRINYFNC